MTEYRHAGAVTTIGLCAPVRRRHRCGRSVAILTPHLPPPPKGRTIVVGAGKAAAAMAKAVEEHWPGPLVRPGGDALRPWPALPRDRSGRGRASGARCRRPQAARRILAMVQGLTADDLVLCLISGGGSALLALPGAGLTLDDKQAVNKALLKSGATISRDELRAQTSLRDQGRPAGRRRAPGAVVSLLISDVPGDDPSVIASGPTVPDPSTRADALAFDRKYGIDAAGRRAGTSSTRRRRETPKPGDPRLRRRRDQDRRHAAGVAAGGGRRGRERGLHADHPGRSRGRGARVARCMPASPGRCARQASPRPPPAVIISGGETTVTVRGQGRGGRNAEFLLALAVALDGAAGHLGRRRRHRRHRRHRGQCRRPARRRTPWRAPRRSRA